MEGKLAPKYIGPFKILERRGEVAYQLELLESSSGVHDVFHVSQLKKCLRVPEEQIPLEELTVKEDLTYKEFPVKILETAERVTRSRVIKMCKVQWNRYTEGEAPGPINSVPALRRPHLILKRQPLPLHCAEPR